jgi:hypothetical protein
MTLPSAPEAVAPVPLGGGDVEAHADGSGSARPNGAVVHYRSHYCPPLEPVNDSALSTPDWSA